jgi:hypothetical protein
MQHRDTETILKCFERRCQAARNAGGVSQEEILDNLKTAPKGWTWDPYTNFWLPPNVVLL